MSVFTSHWITVIQHAYFGLFFTCCELRCPANGSGVCDADQSFESSVAAMASDRRSTQTSERSKSAVQVWTDEKSRHSSLRLMIDSWTGFLRDTLPVEPEQPFCHGLLG